MMSRIQPLTFNHNTQSLIRSWHSFFVQSYRSIIICLTLTNIILFLHLQHPNTKSFHSHKVSFTRVLALDNKLLFLHY